MQNTSKPWATRYSAKLLPGHQVEHVVPVDERRHQQHRRLVRDALGARAVAQQLPLVLLQEDVGRGDADLRLRPGPQGEEVGEALHA